MNTRLRPGMVVQAASDERQAGLIIAERLRQPGDVPVFDVEWVGSGDAQNQTSVDFVRHAPQHVLAGDVYGKIEVLEVDMTAEVMKVRVGEHRLPEWIDVRLAHLPASWATRAAQIRSKYIADDRAMLDWYKPGQIVVNAAGKSVLARPATVIRQLDPLNVELVTSNGTAMVDPQYLMLSANSLQDLAAKEAQTRKSALEAFGTEVREKVMDAKQEHDLCNEGVREFLESLGIKTPVHKVRAVMHLTVEVEVTVVDGTGMTRLDLDRATNKDWWGNTLKFDDDGKDLQFQSDDDLDMESLEVRLISQSVDEIHDESYIEGEN